MLRLAIMDVVCRSINVETFHDKTRDFSCSLGSTEEKTPRTALIVIGIEMSF